MSECPICDGSGNIPLGDDFDECPACPALHELRSEIVMLCRALRRVTFEGLTKHHETPKLIPSEALRLALVEASLLLGATGEGGGS